MIATAIGLETGSNRTEAHNGLQDWLAEHGLQPYMPQLAHEASYNIALQYQDNGLNWTARTVAAVSQFVQPMIFHYNRYYYLKRPGALQWEGVSQDKLNLLQMTRYLIQTRAWLAEQSIAKPWMMVDEPPHPGWSKSTWTQEQEDRITKFVWAAVGAGWTIGVAVAAPAGLAYWQARLPERTRWILHAKHSRADYEARLEAWPANIWLYNKRDTMIGLRQQMQSFGASGYLHWSINWAELPLARILNDGSQRAGYEILPAMHDLLTELANPRPLTLETLDARLTIAERFLGLAI